MKYVHKKFSIIPAIYTMLDKDGNVDVPAQKKLVRHLINKGVDGFYIGGATGEAFTLDTEDRKTLIKACIEEINGEVLAIAYTGSNNTKTAVELSKYAESVGADYVSSIPPHVGNFSFEMIKDYYTDIANSVNIPLLIYSNSMWGSFTEKQTYEICNIPNCDGMKYTSFNHYLMKRCKMIMPDKLIFSGADEMIGSAMICGVEGAIGSTYNFSPEIFIELRDVFERGDMKEFLRLNEACTAIVDAFVRNNYSSSMKAMLSKFGFGQGYARKPTPSFEGKDLQPVIDDLIKIREKYDICNVQFMNKL